MPGMMNASKADEEKARSVSAEPSTELEYLSAIHKSLKSIRTMVLFFTVLTVIGIVLNACNVILR